MNATAVSAPCTSPPASGPPGEREAPQRLLDALCSVVAGVPKGATTGPLRIPAVAAAFAAEAELRPVDLGDGLWAAVRSGMDGRCRVLAVHNVSRQTRCFEPPEELHRTAAPLRFLSGAVRTALNPAGGTVYELGPHEFVWLTDYEAGPLNSVPSAALC